MTNFLNVLKSSLALLAAMFIFSASARDLDGRYASSPLHEWFNGLKSEGGGPCCSQSDGFTVEDPDWDVDEGHYRVRLDGQWIDIPDANVIKEPNISGRTMVWPYTTLDGTKMIRCFLPGSMT